MAKRKTQVALLLVADCREVVEEACRAMCMTCAKGTPLVEGGHLYDDGGKNLPWYECPAEPIRYALRTR